MSGREPEEEVENAASRQRWHAMAFHWPYDVHELQRLLPSRLEQTLLGAIGLGAPSEDPPVQYSPGVEVRVGVPTPV